MKNHIRKALALLLILSMMMGIASASEIDGITGESMLQNEVINEETTVSEESAADQQQNKADKPMDEPATRNSDEGDLSDGIGEQEDDTEANSHSESDQETGSGNDAVVDTETDTGNDAGVGIETDTYSIAGTDANEDRADMSCFDLSAVALSALSDDCAHDELYVYENTSEWSYEIIDEDTHRLTYTIISRRLTCESCGKVLQVVNVNKPVTRVEEHGWCSVDDTPYRVKCIDCEAIKDFEKLCDHERTTMYEDGNLYCIDCGKVIVLNPEQTYCQHQNYSVYDAKKPYVECWYRSIDETQHLKITETYTFSGSDGFGVCKDCGIWLGLTDGKVDAVGITDYGGEYDEAGHNTVIEEHRFVDGVCSACGQAQNTCSHSATVTAENKEKTTSRVKMIEGDTEHHKVITTKHMDLFCADCGSLVAEGETVEEERVEAHTPYWGGACSVCGIGSSCQHANAVDRKYTGDSWTDYVWTGKGNQHYRIDYKVTKDCVYCYECERVGILNAQGTVSGNYVSPDFVRSEIARNVENCYLVSNMGGEHCDYCFHYTSEPDIETPTKPTVTIIHPANNATVSPNQDLKVTWDGTLLGYDGEDNYTDYEYVFCHVIVTEAGLNFSQGAVFPVYSGKNEYTIPAGTMEAGKNYKIYITFGNQSDYHAEIGADVLVIAAGETIVCDHSAGHYNDVLDESVKPVYSNITETTHCVQYSYKRYCADCGAYIKNVLSEGFPPVEHEFGEGDTCECGYQNVEESEDKPFVRGFTMSQASAKVGETVDFTLDIANFREGETLTIEFCADSWNETFKLTAPNNVFSRAFSQAGNRSIKFRVVGGEYCPAQTLVVEANRAKIIYASFSEVLDKVYMEKAEGQTFVATVGCNVETELVELYIGKDGKNYTYSKDYEERDGVRIFALPLSLGRNSKSYAGKYEVFVNALKGVGMPVEDSKSFGTLTIQHVATTASERGATFYKYTDEGHTLYQKITRTTMCEICDYKSTEEDSEAIGGTTAHSIGENGKCSVCGYGGNAFETLNTGKDYESVKSVKTIISDGKEATKEWDQTGIIRYVEQFGYNEKTGAFWNYTFEEYWGNDKSIWGKSNGIQQYPYNMCTRAAASMAFSYLGKNVLPKDMKNEFGGGSYYDSDAKNAGCIVDGRNYKNTKITTKQFIEWYNDYASDTDGVYSPVSIRALYYDKKENKDNKPHAFTIIGRSSTDPNRFYIADPGDGSHIREIVLQDVNGELRIAEYIGAQRKVFSGHIVTDIWRYVST